jgi:H+/gluconate symporter-like permease
MDHLWALGATIGAVAALLVLVLVVRLQAFLALVIVAIGFGLVAGLGTNETIAAVQAGIGGTLGTVAVVVGLGALFGAILELSGGVESFARMLTERTGLKGAPWALTLVGFLVSIPAFFDVPLIILAQGSATVAMITAAGLAAPVLEPVGLSAPALALVVIAIAAGATVVSHVNDSGFWLVSRYLGLSEVQTLKSWTLMTTIAGLTGFAVALALSLIV